MINSNVVCTGATLLRLATEQRAVKQKLSSPIASKKGYFFLSTFNTGDSIILFSSQEPCVKILNPCCSIVNEDSASVYSASKEAEREFPDLDINLRSAGSTHNKHVIECFQELLVDI